MTILSAESRVNSTCPQWRSLFDCTIQQISSSSVQFGWGRSVRNISIDLLTCGKVYISNHICSWLIKLNVSSSEQTSNTVDLTGLGSLALSMVLNFQKKKPQPSSGGRVCGLLILENSKAFSDLNNGRLASVGGHGNSGNMCCYTSPIFFL